MDILKTAKRYMLAAFVATLAAGLASCERMFDDEGDCDVTHELRFRYDKNLKWADAFPSEVKSVNLYAFDSNGIFVREYRGRGEALSQPDYSIVLDLPAGDYTLLAWCGLENEGADAESFTVPQPVAGVTTLEEMTCSLNTKSRAGAYSDERLNFLYHGCMDVSLVDNHDGKTIVHTMNLTKDTNHIRIILQELSSEEDMNPDNYGIRIEAVNGVLAYDNEVLGTEVVTYEPWWQQQDEVGVGKVDVTDGSVNYVKGVVADLSTSRLMASQKKDLWLVITNLESEAKEEIVRVPILQYALMSREYYELAYGHRMTEQDFLDREDEYVMTFFLQGNRWMNAYIDIHQWRIVLHNYEVSSARD